ncbi:MAG: radical SAM/SPASM domain-containing protein [Rhodospirillales bacterium]
MNDTSKPSQPPARARTKVRDLTPTEWRVPEMPERLLLDLRTDCNLKCPKCLLHGDGVDGERKHQMIGTMDADNARKILDEVMAAKPLIQPSWWGEPLLARNLEGHIRDMKERGIAVCMNTNGLTLTEKLARFFVEVRLDAIFFSLDATKPETLLKTRGIDKLDKIVDNLRMMLRIRGDGLYPRIGATLTVEPANQDEVEEFVAQWTPVVDVVRIGLVYAGGELKGLPPEQGPRKPCALLYQTMPIHYNGDVSICCFDSLGDHLVGNVFKDGGVRAVWHGEELTRLRRLHESGRFDEIPFCKNCNAWAGYMFEEEVRDGLLIRRSPQFVYYNRIDRLGSWHDNLRGHRPPPRELLEKVE